MFKRTFIAPQTSTTTPLKPIGTTPNRLAF